MKALPLRKLLSFIIRTPIKYCKNILVISLSWNALKPQYSRCDQEGDECDAEFIW